MIWNAPGFLWLLLLLPLLYVLSRVLASHQRKKRALYFSDSLFERLQPHRWESGLIWRNRFFYAGLFFLIIAMAGPKIGTEVREVQRERLDLIVALDLSLSMKAEDVRPSRLEKARFEINRLLDHLDGDRIGLIVFTGEAMLHCPLTTDYSAFRMFLDIADTDIMPSTTTDFKPMMREAANAFRSAYRSHGDNERASGRSPGLARTGRQPDQAAEILLLFSDGEDHFDRFSEPYQELLDMGVYIFSVGIGTVDGGTIPRFDTETGAFRDFHRDRQGRVVTTRLVPETLREIAEGSGGQYYQISRTAHNIEGFIRQLNHLERSVFATEEITSYQNRFYYPAIVSLLSFIAMLLMPGYRPAVK